VLAAGRVARFGLRCSRDEDGQPALLAQEACRSQSDQVRWEWPSERVHAAGVFAGW